MKLKILLISIVLGILGLVLVIFASTMTHQEIIISSVFALFLMFLVWNWVGNAELKKENQKIRKENVTLRMKVDVAESKIK